MKKTTCARRFFLSYLKETNKINNRFLIKINDYSLKHRNKRAFLLRNCNCFIGLKWQNFIKFSLPLIMLR